MIILSPLTFVTCHRRSLNLLPPAKLLTKKIVFKYEGIRGHEEVIKVTTDKRNTSLQGRGLLADYNQNLWGHRDRQMQV
jgi:hypothetical protein